MDSPVASTDQGLGGRTISFEELYNLSYLVFGEHWFHSSITCWTYSTWSAKGGRLLMLQTKTSWNIPIFFFQGNLTRDQFVISDNCFHKKLPSFTSSCTKHNWHSFGFPSQTEMTKVRMMKLVGNRPHSCLARSCDAVLRTNSLGQNVRSQCWGGNVGWIAPMTKSTPRMSAALMHLCAVRNKTFNQFENTNYAHQWTPCMEGSIFFAPTTQITNLYFCPIRCAMMRNQF